MRLGRDVLGLDLYEVLGVGKAATGREIRAAYLDRVRASHPDLNPRDTEASARTARLNVAARVLLDPALRSLYDRVRGAAQTHGPTTEQPHATWYYRATREQPDATPDDWTSASPRPPRTAATSPFFRDLRGVLSQASWWIDERLSALPARSRFIGATLLFAGAFWLIAAAQPKNLLTARSAPPTSVSPAALSP